MMASGRLPQICVLTLWDITSPITLKVTGIYKHSTKEDATSLSAVSTNAESVAYYTLSGTRIGKPSKGINIVKMADGTTKKVLVK